jgi:hypothetical protein
MGNLPFFFRWLMIVKILNLCESLWNMSVHCQCKWFQSMSWYLIFSLQVCFAVLQASCRLCKCTIWPYPIILCYIFCTSLFGHFIVQEELLGVRCLDIQVWNSNSQWVWLLGSLTFLFSFFGLSHSVFILRTWHLP